MNSRELCKYYRISYLDFGGRLRTEWKDIPRKKVKRKNGGGVDVWEFDLEEVKKYIQEKFN